MNRIILAAIVIFAVACGAAIDPTQSESNDVEQTSQGATVYYSRTNGSLSLPTSSTKFCRLVYASSKGGHAYGDDAWSTWVSDYPFWYYKRGTLVSASSLLWAKPYGPAAPPSRTASATAICEDFGNFGFGPNASRSGPTDNLYLAWPVSVGDVPVNEDTNLWQSTAWCYLNGWEGVSNYSEWTTVYRHPASGYNYIHAFGYPSLTSHATCVFPDRSWQELGPYTQDGEGVTVGPAADGKTLCAFAHVQGNMDDTMAYIYQDAGYWKLMVQNKDPNDFEYWKRKVKMTCARFP